MSVKASFQSQAATKTDVILPIINSCRGHEAWGWRRAGAHRASTLAGSRAQALPLVANNSGVSEAKPVPPSPPRSDEALILHLLVTKRLRGGSWGGGGRGSSGRATAASGRFLPALPLLYIGGPLCTREPQTRRIHELLCSRPDAPCTPPAQTPRLPGPGPPLQRKLCFRPLPNPRFVPPGTMWRALAGSWH